MRPYRAGLSHRQPARTVPGPRRPELHRRTGRGRTVGNSLDRPAPPGRHAVLGDYPAIGLADAMNVVLAREFRTDVIATLDRRHFRMIRPLTRHEAFRLLPDDRRRAAS